VVWYERQDPGDSFKTLSEVSKVKSFSGNTTFPEVIGIRDEDAVIDASC
jgi:hypothetical protein